MNPGILEIPSTTLPSECYAIFELVAAKVMPDTVVVEIGTGAGRVTAVLAAAIAGNGSVLYTVDDYSQLDKYSCYGDWQRDTAKDYLEEFSINGHVKFIDGESSEVARNFPMLEGRPIGFLYLDGSHKYNEVCREIEAWYPLVSKGGIIAGHDWDPNCEDGRHVIKAVCDKLLINPNHHLNVVGRVWYMEKG